MCQIVLFYAVCMGRVISFQLFFSVVAFGFGCKCGLDGFLMRYRMC